MTGRTLAAMVFDLDGTLVDSTSCVTAAYREVAALRSGRQYSESDIVAAYPLGPAVAILSHLLDRPATSEDERAYLSALRRNSSSVSMHSGVPEALDALHALGVATAVFTGASNDAAHQLLGCVDLLRHFPVIVGSDRVRPKPAPDGIFEVCRRLEIPAYAAAYVGDSPLDLQAARASGALAVAAAWGHQYDTSAPADAVVDSPSALVDLVFGSRRSPDQLTW